ncbi:MAG: hypothetical protein B7Z44_20045 [Caulobacter sp. 12-67-6]|nr:MAG: hypothetical protein B7Z44_20045 [Caulobacter sp. 12-67-6]
MDLTMAIRTITMLGVGLSALLLAACGTNLEQRAATGALGGLVVAGPVGAAVGAVVGVVVDEVEEK